MSLESIYTTVLEGNTPATIEGIYAAPAARQSIALLPMKLAPTVMPMMPAAR